VDGNRLSFWEKLMDAFIPARQAARHFARENDKLEAFSRAIPLEYCGWDQSGVQAMSPGFCKLFGIAAAESVADIQAALAPDEAARLEALYDRLLQYGEHFEMDIAPQPAHGALRLFGKRGVLQEAQEIFSVLWAMDTSDFSEKASRAAADAATAEQREADMRAGVNALPFPVWLRDQNLDFSWCNKSYAQAVDGTLASVVADQKSLPLTGANRSTDASPRVLAQRAIATGAPQSMRGHIIVGGQRRLFEMVEFPMPAQKRTIGFALDATREEEWAQSYDRLAHSQRETLEQLRTAIVMFDADMRLEFYNSAYEHLTGLSGTWMDGRPKILEVLDKLRELRKLPEQADFRQYRQQWVNRFTSLIEPQEEMQYLPDGTVVRAIYIPRPMGGLLITLEDVTSRLELETSYNTLMAVQRETLDNLSEGIAVFGEDGRLRLSNQSFARMWGVDTSEQEGAPHITRILEKIGEGFDSASWPKNRAVILSNALERAPRRGRLEKKDGTVLEYSVVPLPDGNILNAWFDITDTVKVEQALTEKNAALEEADKLKMDFLANVSYQLRTPLNAIMGFGEMLHQQYFGPLNDRQKEYTVNMIEAGQRLVSLVNDILDLSTIEAGYMKLYPQEIGLQALVSQVVDLTQDWARKQKIEILVDCPPELKIFADDRRVKQVLLNLISNAINYSPAGGVITIAAAADAGETRIAVRDTGLGIPAEDLARVFTPFERIRSKRTHRRSGAGLGLSLVKSIIELHGGRVEIESREGAGTMVTCILPGQPAVTGGQAG
jgi:signal transduction histidine kinase